MTFNPYKILGIKKTATPEEIRAAYIAAAKEHHPDAGGGEDDFKRVQTAFDILKDPHKRARYDETGFIAGDPECELRQVAIRSLMDMFSRLMEEIPEHASESIDLIKIMRDASTNALMENEKQLIKLSAQEAKIQRWIGKLRKRLKTKKKGQNNFILFAAEQKLQSIAAQKNQPKRIIDVIKKSLELLEDFEYQFDAPSPIRFELGNRATHEGRQSQHRADLEKILKMSGADL